MKILKYLFLPFLFVSSSSYALAKAPFYGEISTNINGSPSDDFLGKTFKLKSDDNNTNEKDPIELKFTGNRKYLINRNDVDITVFKDKNNLNRIKLFSKYDLVLNGKNEGHGGYFYALCPVTEKTTKDLSEVEEVKYIDGQKVSKIRPIYETLSEKIIDPGFFTVAHKSNERHNILTKQYSETFVEVRVQILCLDASNTIKYYQLEEINRKKALGWIENP